MSTREPAEESLGPLRRMAVDSLMEHFAQEHLSVEEFERRIARARSARTAAELRELLADLPGRGGPPPPPRDRSLP